MDQRRKFMQGGLGHPYQNGPRQMDAVDSVYGHYGPSRGQGRPNGPGNFRNGERMDSRTQQNGTTKQKEETLTENRIFPMERPSPMFPNAKWFCRLCHQHFNQMVTALEHCTMRIHARKKAALDLRKVVLAMPRIPEESHRLALEKELMNVYNAQKMTEENLELRKEILNEVSTYLQENLKKSDLGVDQKYLDFDLHLQGSSLSKLGLSSSDINMDLHLCQGGPADVQAKIYFEILRILEQWPVLAEFDAQLNITIPMVKAVHKSSKFSIEILFGGVAPLKTNRLLQDYASLDDRLAPLAVNFRYWAKQCALDDPQKGFLPAHSFAIMTVFYLQQVSPPVLPCIHDSIKDTEDDDYKRPEEEKDWKSENESSIGELWLGMLRFYAAEFPVKKLCVSIRSRKKSFLAQRRWPPRFIGIEDPYCRKKSLAKCIVSDLVMPYLLMCLRASYIYFAVPRFSEKQPLFDFLNQLKLDDVDDPEGDDIEDGLAADEEVQENEDDQEQDEEQDANLGADGVEVEVILDLRGWNQSWPENIQTQIRECDTLQYSMESVSALTGKSTAPVVCVLCRQHGHRSEFCPDAKLPEAVPFDGHAFLDAQGVHSELCQYIYENFRPTISERELSARVRIVQEIEAFIQRTMPEAYLTLFGSSRNGFSLEKADLDICLKYKNKEGIDDSMDVKDIIVRISRILEDYPDISDVQAIASAKVPIVKFHHDPFGVDGDISLYNVLAEHNTAMLKAYSLIDERVVHLGAAFKQYVKLCDMGDASRGSLSSYAYIVMLIHYLQRENVVPVLQALPPIGHPPGEELPKVMIDGWNAYYFDDIDRLKEVWPLLGSNNKTVGQLWLGLIDFYATKFRFDHHVVCIRRLEPLSRLEKTWTNKPLCVEDPFELDHNLGTGISAKMAKYIFSALITSRNWFLRNPERVFGNPAAIYKHFMNLRELAVGKPPKDRGCKRCGKIGHWIKACPLKQGEASDKKSNRRVCHSCGKPGHIVKDCPTRLKQIRAPKERPTQQQHQQRNPNPPQQPMQLQDNRFPMKLFPSSTQTHPTNDSTNSIGNSFVPIRDGSSGIVPENKTVSEELGCDRKTKNKKSSKKKLAQTQRSQVARAAPVEDLAVEAPSVREKTKHEESVPSKEQFREQPLEKTRPRKQQREEPPGEDEQQQTALPQQQRKKARRGKKEQNHSNQTQNLEKESVGSAIRAGEKPPGALQSEAQHSIRPEAELIAPQKAEECRKVFEFRFDVSKEIADQKPSTSSTGEVTAKPKNQKKLKKKKAKKSQPNEDLRESSRAELQKPSQSSDEIPKPLASVNDCDPEKLENGMPQIPSLEASLAPPGQGECVTQDCDGNIVGAASEATRSELIEEERNTSRIGEASNDGDRTEISTEKIVDKNLTEPTSERGEPQATDERAEVSQSAEKSRDILRDQDETSKRDTEASLVGESGNAQCQPEMSRKKPRKSKKPQQRRASETKIAVQSQATSQSTNDDALGNVRNNESSDTVDPPITEKEQNSVRSKRKSTTNEDSSETPQAAQCSGAGVDGAVGDLCESAKSGVVPLLRRESQTQVEHSVQSGQNEDCEEEKPKVEKTQKAAKRAKNKALRNARKKLERAATLNLNRDEPVDRSQGVTSPGAVGSHTTPETLNHPVTENESEDRGATEPPIAADGKSSSGNEARKRKPKQAKKRVEP